MFKKIISLIFLLSAFSLCKSMYLNTDPAVEQMAFEQQQLSEDISNKLKLDNLKTTFSLKKQVAIKIVKFITQGLIDSSQLQLLPEELNDYISAFTSIESLNPESTNNCPLPEGLNTNFSFLYSLYLIDENSSLFHYLFLLINGLKAIELSKKYYIKITPAYEHLGQLNINPINTIANVLIQKATNPNVLIDRGFTKLVECCIKFNNLNLIMFLNLIHEIPLESCCPELPDFGSSMIDLACISSENNHNLIQFLIEEAKRRGIEWEKIISHQAVLRGIITPHQEKKSFLIRIATGLNVDFTKTIGSPIQHKPILLCILWGNDESFKFFLKKNTALTKKSHMGQSIELYEDILGKLTLLTNISGTEFSEDSIKRELEILKMFQKHIIKYSPEFSRKKNKSIENVREKLNTLLNQTP